jgi:hypothetical protein
VLPSKDLTKRIDVLEAVGRNLNEIYQEHSNFEMEDKEEGRCTHLPPRPARFGF